MQLITSIIEDLYTLGQAKALLYEYYIKNLKWNVPPDNDSGITIKRTDQYNKLVDDYDHCSIWFSVANEKNEMVACARLCKEDPQGLLEIERYFSAKQRLQTVLNSKKELNLIELNREAILPDYPDNKVASLLLLECIFKYCKKYHYSVLTTTNIPEWLKLYNSLPFPRLDGCQFSYAETDPKPVEVYFIEHKHIDNIINKINFYLKESCYVSTQIEAPKEEVGIKQL